MIPVLWIKIKSWADYIITPFVRMLWWFCGYDYICGVSLQGGDGGDSAQWGSQSGHGPPPHLDDALGKWQEPHCVQVYLQGGAHKGALLSIQNTGINACDCFTSLLLMTLITSVPVSWMSTYFVSPSKLLLLSLLYVTWILIIVLLLMLNMDKALSVNVQ